MLSGFGVTVHLVKMNERYAFVIETDMVYFEKGFSPIEFYKSDRLEEVIRGVVNKE